MKLAQYLKTHNMTQRQFAARLGTHYSRVCRWVSEERTPDLATASKISKATEGEVTLEDFLKSTPPATDMHSASGEVA